MNESSPQTLCKKEEVTVTGASTPAEDDEIVLVDDS